MLKEARIDFDQLIHLSLKELKANLKDLSPSDSKFLMRKRRQCKNIQSAGNCRKKQKYESEQKDLVIAQLRQEIEQFELMEEKYRRDNQRLENSLVLANHQRSKKTISNYKRMEEQIIQYTQNFQSQITHIQNMVKMNQPKDCIQNELSRLSHYISDFSSEYGPLDLSIKR